MSEPLEQFVDDVRAIVAAGGGEQLVTERVAQRLRALLAEHRAFLTPSHQAPAPDEYVMYPLHVEPDGSFSVASAVWGPGQVTPIHDHGCWGVIGIYSGVEHERRFEPPAGGAPRYLGQSDLRAGEVCVCCTSDRDVHQVSCATAEPCVGIHVYGADIGSIERRAYDAGTGEVRTFVSSWAQIAG